MDWARAIERNSEALKGIVEVLFAMLGLVGEATVERIPHAVHRAVLRVLHPAESAVRRLIVTVARGLVVKAVPSRPMPKGAVITGKGKTSRVSFKLFDPRKHFKELREGKPKRRKMPRIYFFGPDPRVAAIWASQRPAVVAAPTPPPEPDGLVSPEPLARRLVALKSALENLPRQAKRLARWRLRRASNPNVKFKSPIRPGPPPGHRKKKVHEIDEVLAECHWLAWEAMRLDTS